MPAKSRVFGAFVVIAALFVAGCSSGGGKHATPTTPTATASSTAGTTTIVSPSSVLAFGSCPKYFPPSTLSTLNAGLVGLDNTLVPIVVLSVRLCRYDGWHTPLAGSRVLNGSVAIQLGRIANALPLRRGKGCPIGSLFFLTFANQTERADVEQAADSKQRSDCNIGPTNGTWGGGESTPNWLNELSTYTTGADTTGTVVGTLREVGGPSPGLNRQVRGTVIATSEARTHRQVTATASRPFSLTLPVGTYQFTGSSPLINGGQFQCSAAPVVVVGGKTTHVEVVCSID